MEILTNKYRRDGNQMVASAYIGVASGGRTVATVTAVNRDADRLERSATFGPGLARGQGGNIGTFILGGMVTTLDEVEYIVEGIKEKRFVQRKSQGEIVTMCGELAERRNTLIKHYRKNPSEAPRPKPKTPFYLPVGYRMAQTPEPGFRIAVRQ